MSIRATLLAVTGSVAIAMAVGGCSVESAPAAAGPRPTADHRVSASQTATAPARSTPLAAPRVARQFRHPLPGMPPVERSDVYAAAAPTGLRKSVARAPSYLYVPNSFGAPTTTVISQRTHKIVRVLHTGELSQHVTPSWNLHSLYVEASAANQLVQINPRTARIE